MAKGSAKGSARKRVSFVFARVVHAAVEGTAFVWTTEGFRALLLVHSAALMWALGPKKTIALGVQCGLACSAAKFCTVLIGSTQKGNGKQSLESIWDFEPPGDLGDSGAWKVLKELALTMSSGADSHDELRDVDFMPLPDLLVRLTFLYKHIQEHPVVDCITEEDIIGQVTPEDVDLLCKYLYFADQSYDCGTEENLKQILAEHGLELNFAKLESTWAQHCPAYFVATNPEMKEVLITVRGTAQVEDVVTDLTALPTKLGETGHLVHGGIHASAVWLYDRLLSLAQGMQAAGYSITLVGHSLGAGAAALLALMFKAACISDVKCYAFATPNCASLPLTQECSEYVTSIVYRDDIVTRFSPESLALLHKQLQELDIQAAMDKAHHEDDKLLRFVSFIARATASVDSPKKKKQLQGQLEAADEDRQGGTKTDDGNECEDAGERVAKQQAQSYRPHIPGRVLYIYRRSSDKGGDTGQLEMAYVKSTCKALRCIRLSEKVVSDHLIDSYFEGFGRPNPSKERQAIEQEKRKDRDEPVEIEQSAEERDKEEKGKWLNWKQKIGLVN